MDAAADDGNPVLRYVSRPNLLGNVRTDGNDVR